jgi:uncharacterized protein YbaR (Trm112 family)
VCLGTGGASSRGTRGQRRGRPPARSTDNARNAPPSLSVNTGSSVERAIRHSVREANRMDRPFDFGSRREIDRRKPVDARQPLRERMACGSFFAGGVGSRRAPPRHQLNRHRFHALALLGLNWRCMALIACPKCHTPKYSLYFVVTAIVPSMDQPQLRKERLKAKCERFEFRTDSESFRMCPFCRGTLKLVRAGGPATPSTYQCLDCQKITTADRVACKDSYFEWLMSRPKSKRGPLFRERPA